MVNKKEFDDNFAFQRPYGHAFCDIAHNTIGRRLWMTAPLEDDLKRASDFMMLQNDIDETRVLCRLRRKKWLLRKPHDITIRCWVFGDYPTELHKIMEGWGVASIYGFEAPDYSIQHWSVMDLKRFRKTYSKVWFRKGIKGLMAALQTDGVPCAIKPNVGVEDSDFLALNGIGLNRLNMLIDRNWGDDDVDEPKPRLGSLFS